jgi:tetratricopeptide (TPR) repeat protein
MQCDSTSTLEAGKLYLRAGRLLEAADEFEKVALHKPDAWDAFYFWGCACGRLKDFDKAEQLFTRVLELRPDHGMAYVHRGHARLSKGFLEMAGADYSAGERHGELAAAGGYECLGLLYAKRYRYELAAHFLKSALRLGRESDAVLWNLGWCFYRLGLPQQSAEQWSKVHRRYPKNAQVTLQLGKAKYLAGLRAAREQDWNSAVTYWTDCLDYASLVPLVEPCLAEGHFRRAAEYLRQGVKRILPDALRHLELAHGLAPDDQRIAYYYALTAAAGGNIARAVTVIRNPPPTNAREKHAYALFLYRAGDQKGAEAVWKKALDDQPQGPWANLARLAMAALHVRSQRWEAAAKLLLVETRNVGIHETLDNRADDLLALSLSRVGARDWAIACLRKTLGRNPQRERSRTLLAQMLSECALRDARQGDWAKASSSLEELLSLDSERADLVERDPGIARAVAAAFLLGGRRKGALSIWDKSQAGQVSDFVSAHFLFTCHYWTALHEENPVKAAQAWRKAIGNAVLLFHADEYWAAWCADRQMRYAVGITHRTIFDLVRRLETLLLGRLPLTSPEGLELRVELAAARALEQLGGMPSPSGEKRTLVCGPFMMGNLRCAQLFGRFVSERLDPGANPDGEKNAMRRLLRCFSRLGLAQVLLEEGRPHEALDELGRACCGMCLAKRKRTEIEQWEPCICKSSCSHFSLGNPAYADLPDREARLRMDAAELAADAHLAMANAMMASPSRRLEDIRASWREARRLANLAEAQERIEKELATRVLGRAAALNSEDRLEDSIQLLAAAHEFCDQRFLGDIAGRLAECLNRRAVREGGAENPQWDAANEDWRQSIELNPYVPERWGDRAVGLRSRAAELTHVDPHRSVRLLREADQLLADAAARFPDLGDWAKQRAQVGNVMRLLGKVLNNRAIESAHGEDEQNLKDLQLAHELVPEDPTVKENLRQIAREYAVKLWGRGEREKAIEVIQTALSWFPDDSDLTRTLNLVQDRYREAEEDRGAY